MTLFLIKLVHTLIFAILSGSVLYILFCGITNRYSLTTTIAISLIFLECIILLLNNGQCPLTTLARNLGATDGQVADIFLPKWFADRLFGICTPLFLGSTVLVMARRFWGSNHSAN